eukprot:CAMPEP_0174369254 /NCGR_PEP_ID=MMETSP0811_2-20130205/91836_1 /TAXON_ID=73025 ORGANISM="Eutreptiella gymnastica-like, Strain CCMP1594" /NCGR_SAMPLE_ID=MMETSP0811_2 /ASSEMBLY_ACC=CAM_ASM_000667 /LENGTH=36 /DNA_ID= /DNA_START= /DNA_END= /DNA_ORIENTATION=
MRFAPLHHPNEESLGSCLHLGADGDLEIRGQTSADF